MTSPLDQQINTYLPLLGEGQKRSLLAVIQQFLAPRPDEQAATQRTSRADYQSALDAALSRAQAGGAISQEEAEKQAAQW